MKRKLLRGLVVLCVFLCLPCSAIGVFAGGTLVLGMGSEPEQVNIAVLGSKAVARGDQFVIEVRVENLAKEAQFLHSIDVDMDYLGGIQVQEVAPAYVESDRYGRFQSYSFGQRIAPGDTLVVSLHVVAHQVGDWSGQFGVCINAPANCLGFDIHTAVSQ